MPQFVESIDDIRNNVKTLHDYLVNGNEEERFFARERLRIGYNLVSSTLDGDVIFGPSRFVGYKHITRKKHETLAAEGILDGRDTNPELERILGKPILHVDADWDRLEELYLCLCERLDVIPVNRTRKFWRLDATGTPSGDMKTTFTEGALSYHVTTRYERDPAARQACIDAYGPTCAICEFDFEAVYGRHGKGFIHVHHLKPLSHARGKRLTNPTEDLVPVCPNCHYMLHRGTKVLLPEELREMMKR
ncbi:HNH endonuclease [Marinicauda pacifica]|uniref:HNH endonuclease n=1 Tax=Marinicauda pacifica TaxID=1133559 RepID=UPI0035C7E280